MHPLINNIASKIGRVSSICQITLPSQFRKPNQMASAVTIPCFNGFSASISGLQSRRHHGNASSKRAMIVRVQTINPEVRKNEEKVVDSVVVSELAKPTTAYCRCWRSATFPLCDGGHMKHNKATGDNVGPLLLKK